MKPAGSVLRPHCVPASVSTSLSLSLARSLSRSISLAFGSAFACRCLWRVVLWRAARPYHHEAASARGQLGDHHRASSILLLEVRRLGASVWIQLY